MKHPRFVYATLLSMAVSGGPCLVGHIALAQGLQQDSPKAVLPPQPYDQGLASEGKTFTGKTVRSGYKFVLADAENLATCQLCDQQKAQGFVNKNVKVTSMLDESSGVSRVTWIDLA
jgi:hypothetical protein